MRKHKAQRSRMTLGGLPQVAGTPGFRLGFRRPLPEVRRQRKPKPGPNTLPSLLPFLVFRHSFRSGISLPRCVTLSRVSAVLPKSALRARPQVQRNEQTTSRKTFLEKQKGAGRLSLMPLPNQFLSEPSFWVRLRLERKKIKPLLRLQSRVLSEKVQAECP